MQVTKVQQSLPVRSLIPAYSIQIFPLTGSSSVAINASNLTNKYRQMLDFRNLILMNINETVGRFAVFSFIDKRGITILELVVRKHY